MATAPTPADRAVRAVVRILGALPEPLQRVIAGPPDEVDGNRLFTEVQMALRLLNSMPGSSFEDLPLPRSRAQLDSEAWIFGDRPSITAVEEIRIPTRSGSLPARRYRQHPDRSPDATVVYFHGGGWVVGGLDSADSVCRTIARAGDLTVISVDYRLAPEHPFPAAVEDAEDAYRWVRDNTDGPVVVAGDSAGGNLAAVVSASIPGRDGPDFQLLFYPVTDLSRRSRSYNLFADGYFLTEKQMDWYRGHYLPDPDLATDPRVSPLLTDDTALAGVAPAHVVVAGFDVLRDEGIAYAEKLRAVGVPTTLQVVTGHIHGFANATGIGTTGGDALRDALAALRAGLAVIRSRPSGDGPRVDPPPGRPG